MHRNNSQKIHNSDNMKYCISRQMNFQNKDYTFYRYTLRWRHNGRDIVSNHQPRHCLLSHIFGRRSKKTSKLRVTGLCAGNSPEIGEFPHKWPVTRKRFLFDDVIMMGLVRDVCMQLVSLLVSGWPSHVHGVLCQLLTLWLGDAIWWHRSGSTLVQVIACCLTAPSHYLNQCRLITVWPYGFHLRGI